MKGYTLNNLSRVSLEIQKRCIRPMKQNSEQILNKEESHLKSLDKNQVSILFLSKIFTIIN